MHEAHDAIRCNGIGGEPSEQFENLGQIRPIAAVAGAILGAPHRDPWPDEWADRLEPRYREWIAEAEQYDFDGSRS